MRSFSNFATVCWLLSSEATAFHSRQSYTLPRQTRLFSEQRGRFSPRPPSSDPENRQRRKPAPPQDPPDKLFFIKERETYELTWKDFTESSLRDELSSRDLPTDGTKDELVTRLDEDDARAAAKQFGEWLKTLVASDFEKGVPSKTIQGAALAAALLGAIAGKGIVTAGVASVGAAYAAILPGAAGNVIRLLGSLSFDAAKATSDLISKIDKSLLPTAISAIGEQRKLQREKLVEAEAKEQELRRRQKAEMASRSLMEARFRYQARDKKRLALQAARQKAELVSRSLMEARFCYQARDKERLALQAARQKAELTLRSLMETRFRYQTRDKERLALEAARLEEAKIAEQARLEAEAKIAEAKRLEQDKRIEQERIAEEVRLAEEARIEQERIAGEARIEQERIAEENRLAEEEARIEQERIAEETRIEQERIAEETRIEQERIAEEARIEQERIAEEARIEQMRITEEARIEQERIAEEARLKEEALAKKKLAEDALLAEKEAREAALLEEDNETPLDDDFSDEDWQASIRAAQESLEARIANLAEAMADEDEKAEWDAAEKLASSLSDVMDDEVDDLDELDIEALAAAARAAVESYEELQDKIAEEKRTTREEWDSNMESEVNLKVEDKPSEKVNYLELTVTKLREECSIRGLPVGGKKADLAFRLENDDARREGRTQKEGNADLAESTKANVSIDKSGKSGWTRFTVVQLKEELNRRGLAAQGKKADLIARLESSDLQQSIGSSGEEESWDTDIDVENLDDITAAARAAVQMYSNDMDDVEYDEAKLTEPSQTAVDMFDLISDQSYSELDNDFDEEALAEAARAAVELFESGTSKEADPRRKEFGFLTEAEDEAGSDWYAMSVAELRNELSLRGLPTKGTKADLITILEATQLVDKGEAEDADDDEFDLEQLARTAREITLRFDPDEEPSDEALMEIEVNEKNTYWEIEESVPENPVLDFSAMTVAELKEELRKRGLSVSGKKSDLIARLTER